MNGLQTKQICARGSFDKVGYPNGGHWGAHLYASVTFTPFFLFSQVYTSAYSLTFIHDTVHHIMIL